MSFFGISLAFDAEDSILESLITFISIEQVIAACGGNTAGVFLLLLGKTRRQS